MATNTDKSEIISADISENEVKKLIEENYDIVAEKLQKLNGYDDLNFRISPPIKMKTNNNYNQTCQHGYVIKIINWKDSLNVEFLSEYIKILLHLREQQVTCPYPIQTNKGEYKVYWSKNAEGNSITSSKSLRSQSHAVILLEFLPGELLDGLKFGEKLCFSIGQLIGRLHTALKPFCGSRALQRPHFLWSLKFVPDVLKYTYAVDEEAKRTMAIEAIEEFQDKVLARFDELEQGIIHGDLNKANLLVPHKGENNEEICGVLDLCDVSESSYLFEIAITITYLCLDDSERLEDIAASIILGYWRKLTDLEFNLLKICICARLSQSLVLGLYTYRLHPGNTYLLKTQRQGWPLLEKLRNTVNDKFIAIIKEKMAYYNRQFLK